MTKRVRDFRDLSFNEIKCIYDLLINQKTTLQEIQKIFHTSKTTIKAVIKDFGLEIPVFKNGRRFKLPNNEEIQLVRNYLQKFRVGYQRCCEALILHETPLTEWKVRQIYEMEGLYMYEKEFKQKNCHLNRFVAPFIGQIWHTDLHFFKLKDHKDNQPCILIAFIDDRSRFIVHAEILEDKSSIGTSNALIRALQKQPKPHMMVIDNGTEFIGHNFLTVLEKNNIRCHRTHPYSPEENGKMERWWQTFDKSRQNDDIEGFVNEYNKFWPHNSLKILSNRTMTPHEAWIRLERWEGHENLDIQYSSIFG